jgi:3',5'-cyclic AMP phosphodiesterase CpdA
LIHISDTHLVTEDSLYNSSSNPTLYLEKMMNAIAKSGVNPDAIIFTGDLADMGDTSAYKALMSVVDPIVERLGTHVIWSMGNHDNRFNFREQVLRVSPTFEEVDLVHWVDGLRVIVLDTSVVGAHYGDITPRQLAWLKSELAMPAPEGTILAMHHPPVPSALRLATLVELRGQKALEEVLRGSDVRTILSGHLHYSSFSTFAGIPVSVATSSCYTQDLKYGLNVTRGQDSAQGFNLVHVYENTILHSVVPLSDGDSVGEFVSADRTETILAKTYKV